MLRLEGFPLAYFIVHVLVLLVFNSRPYIKVKKSFEFEIIQFLDLIARTTSLCRSTHFIGTTKPPMQASPTILRHDTTAWRQVGLSALDRSKTSTQQYAELRTALSTCGEF